MSGPALITHVTGADTREVWRWYDDDDDQIVPDDAVFEVDDIDGDPVTLDNDATIDTDGTIRLLIANDDAIAAGIYRYSLRAQSTDWRYLSAGILRVTSG